MSADQKTHNNRSCSDCMEHGILTLKIGELCQWQKAHEVGTGKWRGRIEAELINLDKSKIIEHANIRAEMTAGQERLYKWAIANLTGVSVILLTLLGHLILAWAKS